MKKSTYDEIDDAFVRDLNQIDEEILDKRFAGGRRIQDYVDAKGGIQYADQTIGKIAEHPALRIHIASVYRWWHYHQVTTLLGEELAEQCPGIKATHVYDLARLMKRKPHQREGETEEDAQRRELLHWASWLHAKMKSDRTTTKEFAAYISDAINENDHTPPATTKKQKKKATPSAPGKASIAPEVALEVIMDRLDDLATPVDTSSDPGDQTNNIDLFIRLADMWPNLAQQILAQDVDDSVVRAVERLRSRCDEILNGLADSSANSEDFRAARKLKEAS